MRRFEHLTIASGNRGKIQEFQTIALPHNISIVSLKKWVCNSAHLSQAESREPDATYNKNAERKCCFAFQAAKVPIFADDSGLELLALDGKPGPLSAHFATPKSGESQDEANRTKVLQLLSKKTGKNRRARFVCSLVFMVEGVLLSTSASCEGSIAIEEKGTNGFGYDPIFIPNGNSNLNFAEMGSVEKNKYSHRAKAFEQLMTLLAEEEIVFVRP